MSPCIADQTPETVEKWSMGNWGEKEWPTHWIYF
jgi:hypothetical protein